MHIFDGKVCVIIQNIAVLKPPNFHKHKIYVLFTNRTTICIFGCLDFT